MAIKEDPTIISFYLRTENLILNMVTAIFGEKVMSPLVEIFIKLGLRACVSIILVMVSMNAGMLGVMALSTLFPF